MKNRITLLLSFLAAFMLTTPALAAPPEGDTKTDEAAPDEKADEAAPDEKADEAKVDEKADDKADEAKTDDKADPAEGIQSDEEAVDAAKGLLGALQQKQWALAVGLGLSLLVFGLRKVKVLSKVPSKALPWVTAALGIVGYVAVALTTAGADVTDAVLGGAMTGAAAVGLWEMLLKHFLGQKSEASES